MNAAPLLAKTLEFLRARRPADALNAIGRATENLRRDPRVVARYAYACGAVGRVGDALAAAQTALDSAELDAVDLDLVGNALILCHQPALAYEPFRRAAALRPDDAHALFNLAANARFVGLNDEAEALYERLITQAPELWEIYLNRSDLRRQTPERNHVADLRRRLAAGPPPRGEIQLSYALGKELEDLSDFAPAFAAFARGARVRRTRMRYSVDEDIAALDLIRTTFDDGYCAPGRGRAEGPGAIFIVGLPRTGSTLLERMLGRHAQIQALGELQMFSAALVKATLESPVSHPANKAALITASAKASVEDIGRHYMTNVLPLRDARPYFIDKLPLNSLYLAPIARALPGARIIHLTRNPADTCVAIFKTLFDEAYPFSYDLQELARYFNAHQRLMRHWKRALGSRLIEVAYERLTSAPEAELSRLLEALGLPFEPVCLSPDHEAAPVMTASASQVRAPINTRSINMAKHYEPWIGPLLEILEA